MIERKKSRFYIHSNRLRTDCYHSGITSLINNSSLKISTMKNTDHNAKSVIITKTKKQKNPE